MVGYVAATIHSESAFSLPGGTAANLRDKQLCLMSVLQNKHSYSNLHPRYKQVNLSLHLGNQESAKHKTT